MSRGDDAPETLRLADLGAAAGEGAVTGEGERAETRAPAGLVPVPETPVAREAARRGRAWSVRLLLAAIGMFTLAGAGAAIEAIMLWVMSGGGWVAGLLFAGALALAGGVAIVVVRELRGMARLARLRRYRTQAAAVQADGQGDGDALLVSLETLYIGRPELEWALSAYRQEGRRENARARLDAFERHVMAPLDEAAQAALVRAVRRAGGGAAISPFALLDIAITAVVDLRLIGEIARVYGGRPGAMATLRLLRIAFTDVIAAGAFEISQDTLGSALGADITARVSGRAGAALVNGLLTAKLGRAAMDACRPVPWNVRTPPGARATLLRAIGRDDAGGSGAK